MVKSNYIHSVPCPEFYIQQINIAVKHANHCTVYTFTVEDQICVEYSLASTKKAININRIIRQKGFVVEIAETIPDPQLGSFTQY